MCLHNMEHLLYVIYDLTFQVTVLMMRKHKKLENSKRILSNNDIMYTIAEIFGGTKEHTDLHNMTHLV